MKILLNGAEREVAAETLAGVLAECGIAGTVATAVNEAFVPAPERAGLCLAEGDRVEVLAPMQGG